jgi:cytochrome c1
MAERLYGGLTGVAAAICVAGLGWHHLIIRDQLAARVHALTGGDPAGKVGPSLKGFSGRLYIGGRQQNTPANLVAWIENPHAIDPQNVMPPMGIGEREARDIAAYLYTLK